MYNNSRSFRTNSFSSSGSRFTGNFRSNRGRSSSKKRGESIDESKYVSKANPTATAEVTIENTFADFSFCDQLNKNLNSRNYSTPTPVQDKSIKPIMEGRDVVALANTGTGKTAAFLLPLIDMCFRDRSKKVLIIAPTRELAQQIESEFKKFAVSMGLYSAICVGGVPIYRQIESLRRRPNFVIGTPGRLKDMKTRGIIDFASYRFVVLDEIDRMLDMGFVDEIKKVLSELPENKQSLFFSATIPPKIRELVNIFLNNPVTIQVSSGDTSKNVDQDIVRVSRDQKFDRLKELLITKELQKVLVFIETKHEVEKLSEDLIRDGFKADSIHGNKRQSQRQKALSRFKENQIQILVATDVAARGLDIDNVTHVINYTLPQTYNDYIHRIGRTGRGDRTGCALTFVS